MNLAEFAGEVRSKQSHRLAERKPNSILRGFAAKAARDSRNIHQAVHESVTFRPYDSVERPSTGSQFASVLRRSRTRYDLSAHFGFRREREMKRRLALALSVLITTSVFAQTDSQSPKPKSAHKSSSAAPVSKQLEDMKDAISAQQQQIKQLQQQVQNRDQAIQTLQQQVGQAEAAAQAGTTGRQRCEARASSLRTQRSAPCSTMSLT